MCQETLETGEVEEHWAKNKPAKGQVSNSMFKYQLVFFEN